MCQERGDLCADSVQARILLIHDLHAADAVYHQICSVNFRTKKQIPSALQSNNLHSKKMKLGRPTEQARSQAFLGILKKIMMSKLQLMT